MEKLFIVYLAAMNLLAFAAMGIDKAKARKGAWRISEKTLFLLAIIGGSVGALAGMYAFRHKTKHWKFVIGMPAVLIMHILLVCSLIFLPMQSEAKKQANVRLNKKKITLQVGTAFRLKVKGTKKKVRWKSSKKKVASVSAKGRVKARKKGKARITAKIGKKKLVCVVTVKKKKRTEQTGQPATSGGNTDTPGSSGSSVNNPGTSPGSDNPSGSDNPGNVTSPSPGPSPGPVIVKQAGFDGGTDGFTPRGEASVASVSGGLSGNCLYVSERSETWHGAGYEAGGVLIPGDTYRIEAYVKLDSGTGTLQCTYQDGAGSYVPVQSVTASNRWTKLRGSFTVPDSFTQFYIYFEMPEDATASFYLEDVVITALEGENLPSIKEAGDPVFGKMGSCLNLKQLQDKPTLAYVKKHYSSFTLENEMKPESVLKTSVIDTETARANTEDYVIPAGYTEETVPVLDFDTVDAVLAIARENGLKMRAHTLVWHSQTPEWFFKEEYFASGSYVSEDVMDARMEMYIRSVMHHVYTVEGGAYRQVVYAWDVANEYLHNDSDANWSAVYGNRSGNLETHPAYIKRAYQIAYDMLEALSLTDSVSLFYNDFNTYTGNTPEQILSLIAYINEGEPEPICRGIGMQSHLDVDSSVELYMGALEKFAQAGLEIQITEWDATINCSGGSYRDKAQTESHQSIFVTRLMKRLVEFQKTTGAITGFTMWGLYDGVSWLGGQQSRGNCHPLLFDSGLYDTKASYYAFMEALRQ